MLTVIMLNGARQSGVVLNVVASNFFTLKISYYISYLPIFIFISSYIQECQRVFFLSL
jgi:hypothetical protein